MKQFHHLGLFVKNLDYGLETLSRIIEIEKVDDVIEDHNLKVRIQFVTDKSNVRYELVAPFGENNPVEPVLKAKKNILNHVAYVTDQFQKNAEYMRHNGCLPLGPPKKSIAFNNNRVMFYLTPLGFIYELIEESGK